MSTRLHIFLNVSKKSSKPAHLNVPLSKTNPCRVKFALQEERIKTSQMKRQIERMEQKIESKGIKVDYDRSNDLSTIISNNIDTASPFMKLFWNQQKIPIMAARNIIR